MGDDRQLPDQKIRESAARAQREVPRNLIEWEHKNKRTNAPGTQGKMAGRPAR